SVEDQAIINLMTNPNYVLTPQEFEAIYKKPYSGEDLASLSSGLRTQNQQALPSGELNDNLGFLFGAGAMGGIAASGAIGGAGVGTDLAAADSPWGLKGVADSISGTGFGTPE